VERTAEISGREGQIAFSRPLRGLKTYRPSLAPAMNCWASFNSPLRTFAAATFLPISSAHELT